MNWLKYSIDPEKKAVFFEFWGISSFKEFETFYEKPEKALAVIFKSSSGFRQDFDKLIQMLFQSSALICRDGGIEVSDEPSEINTEGESVSVSYFDDLFFITAQRDRSLLHNTVDHIKVTDFFKIILETLFYCEKGLNEKKLLNKTASQSSKIRGTDSLDKIRNHYFFSESLVHIKESDIEKFFKFHQIYPVITSDYRAVLYAPVNESAPDPVTDPVSIYALKMAPAKTLVNVNRHIFQIFRQNKGYPDSKISSKIIDYFKNNPKHLKRYRSLSFYKKHLFLMKKVFPFLPKVLEYLRGLGTVSVPQTQILKKIFSFLDQKNTNYLPQDIAEILKILGLIIDSPGSGKAQNKITINTAFAEVLINLINQKKVPSQDRANTVMIDSDYHVTAYKQIMNSDDLYFFLMFFHFSDSDHIYRFEFTSEFVSSALYYGFTMGHVLKKLSALTGSPVDRKTYDYLKHIYNQSRDYLISAYYVIKTESEKDFAEITHFIKKELSGKMKKVKINSSQKKIEVFSKKIFIKIINILEEKKRNYFFHYR